MRLLCLLILVVVLVAVVLFALENQAEVTVQFYQYNMTLTVAELVGAAYVLGMVSGWTVIGIVRRSVVRVTEFPPQQARTSW